MLQGLLLGFSSGTACLASCAPVILPYLLSGDRSVRANVLDLTLFLAGRFAGYLCFGVLAWLTREFLLSDPVIRSRFTGIASVFLGVAMVLYNLYQVKHPCALHTTATRYQMGGNQKRRIFPWVFGFLTGINICPPLLMVLTKAVDSNSLGQSLLYLTAFATGNSIFFIPFPFMGMLRQFRQLKILGELTLYLIAGYYIVKGLINLGSVVL